MVANWDVSNPNVNPHELALGKDKAKGIIDDSLKPEAPREKISIPVASLAPEVTAVPGGVTEAGPFPTVSAAPAPLPEEPSAADLIEGPAVNPVPAVDPNQGPIAQSEALIPANVINEALTPEPVISKDQSILPGQIPVQALQKSIEDIREQTETIAAKRTELGQEEAKLSSLVEEAVKNLDGPGKQPIEPVVATPEPQPAAPVVPQPEAALVPEAPIAPFINSAEQQPEGVIPQPIPVATTPEVPSGLTP